MKRMLTATIFLLLFLAGCSSKDSGMEQALMLRQNLQQSSCRFTAEITADYGDVMHEFTMQCEADESGNLKFTVTEPETIQGITGTIDATGGNLTFDDTVLAFELLTDDQITPVSAPWILVRTLRGGYIHAAALTDEGVEVVINDSYEEDSLQLDIWLDQNNYPKEAEILWQGRRILSLIIREFSYL